MKYIISLLIIILLSVPTCSAGSNLNPVNVGADMVAKGIDLSITTIADSLIDLMAGNTTGNATKTIEPASVTKMIKGFATWSVSPFEYKTIIKIMGASLCLATVFMIAYAMMGAAYVAISRIHSRKLEVLQHIMNTKSDTSAFRNYGQNIVVGCLAMTFMVAAIFMTLLLSKVLKSMIMDGVADSISPSIASVPVLYLAMAIMWVCVAVFFGISNIVICLTAAMSFLLGALYASDRTRHITTRWMDYFFSMVAMQVFVIAVVALTVGFIMDAKSTSDGMKLFTAFPIIEMSLYIGLILFVLIGCVYFVLGKARVGKTAKTVIKMVA